MGQPLPLPTQIPVPAEKVHQAMLEKGFTFGESQQTEYGKFVSFTMPEGWNFTNNSWREDLPQWEFVSPDNMVHFVVYGSWKGSYDNKLNINMRNPPTPFEPIKEKSTIPHDTMGMTPIFEALKSTRQI